MKKALRIVAFSLLTIVLIIVAYVVITFPPIMAGMAAKTMCSCVFVNGRTPQSVRDLELKVFPGLSRASIEVNRSAGSVTGTDDSLNRSAGSVSGTDDSLNGIDGSVKETHNSVNGSDGRVNGNDSSVSSSGSSINRINNRVSEMDGSVTARVLWKTSTAIFREGSGCTLLAERSEADVRAQQMALPSPSPLSDALAWPQGDRIADSEQRRTIMGLIDTVALHAAVEAAFAEPDPSRPRNTSAVVVVYDGQLVAERYKDGIDQSSRLTGWSMTKSITSALIGILVKNGRLSADAPAPVPEWKDDERSRITLTQLLTATSGLEWTESYFSPTAHFHRMFIGSDDKAGYAASLPLKYEPGSHFQYSSGTTNILSRIIRNTVGDDAYYKFPYDSLFYPVGMNRALIEVDASGTFVGSSYAYASARDWARLGMLYLNDGVWNGRRILPEGWVKFSVTPSSAAPRGEYGAQWHLNAGAPGNPANRKLPTLPTDAYWADGFEEQWVMVIPSHRLVVARLGISHHGFDIEGLVNGIIRSLPPNR